MLSVEQCRDLLSIENGFPDTMVEELRNALYATATLAFEAYWSETNSGSKNPLGLWDGSRSSDTV